MKKQVDYLIYSKEYNENYMDTILDSKDWEKHSNKYYQLEHELIKNLKGKDGLFLMDDLESLSDRISVHKAMSSEIFQDEIRSMQNKGWNVIGNIRFDFELLEEGEVGKRKDKWCANFKLHLVKYEN